MRKSRRQKAESTDPRLGADDERNCCQNLGNCRIPYRFFKWLTNSNLQNEFLKSRKLRMEDGSWKLEVGGSAPTGRRFGARCADRSSQPVLLSRSAMEGGRDDPTHEDGVLGEPALPVAQHPCEFVCIRDCNEVFRFVFIALH